MRPHVEKLRQSVGSVLLGKSGPVMMAIVTLIGKGNLLVEDVPGVGKTTLAAALARATDCDFSRIQFTSDLMPSDIIGVNIFNQERRDFEFRPGPVFTNILLADEINRTNPKTQSALLEAMNEHRVTVEHKTFTLAEPFMVIATQNPAESYGTFPLPESQLDRFMAHISIGYPSVEDEKRAVLSGSSFGAIERIRPVVSKAEILGMQQESGQLRVDDSVIDYMMRIVAETRRHAEIRTGVSTRGAQFFLAASRSHAYCAGRDFVTPDDVRSVASAVLGHRILLKSRRTLQDADLLIREIVSAVPVPV